MLVLGGIKKVHFLTFSTIPLLNSGIQSSVLIQGSPQRLDCRGLNDLQKKVSDSCFQICVCCLYCTKENTSPLFVKSAVCGKIYQGTVGVSDKERALFHVHSQSKAGSGVLVVVIFPHLLANLRL